LQDQVCLCEKTSHNGACAVTVIMVSNSTQYYLIYTECGVLYKMWLSHLY